MEAILLVLRLGELDEMSLQLANANVVVTARQFNPSIMNQLWLVDNGLVGRDDFRPGCVFSDIIANVLTRRFILFVSPERLQFTPNGDVVNCQQLVTETVGKIVGTLPHTPYTAAGLNFTWHLHTDVPSVAALCRRLFLRDQLALYRSFDSDDARFGGYLSKDALGCRMKLDIKPIVVSLEDEHAEMLQFAFNFNIEIAEVREAVAAIQGLLSQWDEARQLAADLMQTVQTENL